MKSMSQTDYRRQPALIERVQGRIVGIGRIDESAVLDAYRRWAPVYDYTFGLIAREGRRHSVEVINSSSGRVLEVGVGTGLSLPDYEKHLEVVGIDLSPEMLEKARERVDEEDLDARHGPARNGRRRPEVRRCLLRHRRRHVRHDRRTRARGGDARAYRA